MTTIPDTQAALCAELTARGIKLQARGDRLRFRPRMAITPELVATHKSTLLVLLAVTKTPASDRVSVGSGGGDAEDVLTATRYTADESRMLADVPAYLRDAVERIQRVFSGAELVSIRKADAEAGPLDAPAWVTPDRSAGLPPSVADLARARDDWTPTACRARLLQLTGSYAELHPDRAAELRRAAIAMTPALVEVIVEHEGGLSRELAEAAVAADTVTLTKGRDKLASEQASCYRVQYGRTTEHDAEGDRSERADPLSHIAGNGYRGKRAVPVHERRNGAHR